MEKEDKVIFNRFRDGEEVDYFHPILSYVQGSLAEERRNSTGRFGKDCKEFRLVQKLNNKSKIDLVSLLSCKVEFLPKEPRGTTPSEILMNRLSHLGATYTQIPNLSINITGIRNLEGTRQGKKIFDLLVYLNEELPEESWIRYVILEKLGKILFKSNREGRYWLNSLILFNCMGRKEIALLYIESVFQYNQGALSYSKKHGKNLASRLYISFYSNTRMYNEKIRRRGYSRSSPVRPGSSKSEIREVQNSWEALEKQGLATINSEGEYQMIDEEKKDIEEIIFNIFKNASKSYELYQQEILEQQKKKMKIKEPNSPPKDKE